MVHAQLSPNWRDAKIIHDISGLEAVQKRPGMYVGEPGPLRFLRCIGLIVNKFVYASTKPAQWGRPRFPDHGILRVGGAGQKVEIVLAAGAVDTDDTNDRWQTLFRPMDALICGGRNDLTILNALTDKLSIAFWKDGAWTNLSEETEATQAKRNEQRGGVHLWAAMTFGEQVPACGVSQDLIHGYLEGIREKWVGLVIDDIKYGAT
ncbi:MAG: hypothetical protein AAFQ66_08345 [Pseudomonadota bacterium]